MNYLLCNAPGSRVQVKENHTGVEEDFNVPLDSSKWQSEYFPFLENNKKFWTVFHFIYMNSLIKYFALVVR